MTVMKRRFAVLLGLTLNPGGDRHSDGLRHRRVVKRSAMTYLSGDPFRQLAVTGPKRAYSFPVLSER